MRELRIGAWLVTVLALAGFGCDGDRGDMDGGVTVMDSGGGTHDSGGGTTDSGPRDSGGGGGSCGPAGGECDLSNATSCGTGNACYLQGSTMDGWTTVCAAAGTGTDGTACDPTMAGQCAEGFGCGDEMLCRRWCCNVSDCEIGQICNIFAGAGPSGSEIGLCLLPDSCTLPPPQTGCDAGEACNLSGAGETICDAAGTATEGMPCEFRNSCVPGFACISTMAGGDAACRQYCDMAATMPCPDTFMCAGLTGAPTGVGVCIPMPTP